MANPNPYMKRFIVLYTLLGVLSFFLIGRLFVLQVIDGADYSEITMKRLSKSMPQKAPRGEILDRYGRPIVSNRTGYSIQLTKMAESEEELNQTVLSLIQICEANQTEYYDSMPITREAPYVFTYQEDTEEEARAKIQKYNKSLKLDEGMEAPEVLAKLKERYHISPETEETSARKIIGVRSEMELRLFSKQNAYTFANDVDMNVVTSVKETTEQLTGVNIVVDYIREYNEPGIASHILGRIGPIYKEEYDVLKEKGYGINDVVGKDGIEKICEDVLRGKDGVNNIEQDANGKIISTVSSSPAVPGNDVILTIDLELQKVAEKSLAEVIKTISSGRGKGYDADSGAVVVEDIHTGELLAIASYPTFDLSKFNETYEENYKNKAKPLWNRAIQGTYAPGSTFKMVTAIAALEEGIVTPQTRFDCKGIYRYYASSGYTPACWIYTDTGRAHTDPMTVANAIKNSCNYYFYEAGRLLTIEKLNEYTKKFGLGQLTGIELPGEAKGVIAGPEYSKKMNTTWWPGNTLQAAIGQSDNLFTPLQLANYISTLANGGTRYQPHLVKKVKEYDSSHVISESMPKVLDSIQMKPQNYKAVMEGMRSVTEDGTASNVFRNFEIRVGGKTGSAEVPKGSANGIFTCFAPYENPQIAISVIVEHGAHGNSIAPVARDIIAKNFTGDMLEYIETNDPLTLLN